MRNDSEKIKTLDALAVAAKSGIGGLRTRVLRRANGAPLAAPDFISWNLLVAQMIEEARSGIFKPDPGQSLWRA